MFERILVKDKVVLKEPFVCGRTEIFLLIPKMSLYKTLFFILSDIPEMFWLFFNKFPLNKLKLYVDYLYTPSNW